MIIANFARPLGAGPFPGMLIIHHLPGWDDWYKEATRKFAANGYIALCPNLYFREGHGTPEDVAAKVGGARGMPDEQVLEYITCRNLCWRKNKGNQFILHAIIT